MANRPWDAQEAGTIWRGWWETGLHGTPALPVLAARGRADGPTLLVTGGVHGDEYEGPAAIHALFAGLDVSALRGRLIGLPVINIAASEARSRVSPGDGVNLNRVFSSEGRVPDGATAALAKVVFETFVRSCHVLIDLHSGGLALDHLPLIGWYAGQAEAERLARNFDLDLRPWILPDVPGVLSYEAQRAGKIALGAEWHGGARLDPAGVDAYASSLRRAMRTLEMLPADAETRLTPDTRPPICGDYQETARGGLFLPAVALGDRLEAGARLGVLYDTLGKEIEPVTAQWSGIVAGLPHLPLLHPGDRVTYIG